MALQTYKFAEIVQNIVAAMQSSAAAVLNFTPGSVLRAISEATAGVVLWLQAIILDLLNLTRAATSKGPDLDSWMADFDFARLPATNATGVVTFSRFTSTQQALIPFGAIVQTADGTQSFAVTANSSALGYTAAGYVIPAGSGSLGVLVAALNAGTQGNVLAGSIATLSTPIPFVDTVSNASPFVNGIDAEADPAFRARFVLYLAALSAGTKTAVAYAISRLQQGLTYTITENYDYAGNYVPASFYVVVDDGTGYPSTDLLTNVANSIDSIRAASIPFAVFPPVVVIASVTVTITNAAGFSHPSVVAAVASALARFLNALPLATSLPYTQLASVIYAVPGVTNASGILLNGGTADLVVNQKQKLLAGTITVA